MKYIYILLLLTLMFTAKKSYTQEEGVNLFKNFHADLNMNYSKYIRSKQGHNHSFYVSDKGVSIDARLWYSKKRYYIGVEQFFLSRTNFVFGYDIKPIMNEKKMNIFVIPNFKIGSQYNKNENSFLYGGFGVDLYLGYFHFGITKEFKLNHYELDRHTHIDLTFSVGIFI